MPNCGCSTRYLTRPKGFLASKGVNGLLTVGVIGVLFPVTTLGLVRGTDMEGGDHLAASLGHFAEYGASRS